MRSVIGVPNFGSVPDTYDSSFLNRALRSLEVYLQNTREAGDVTFEDVTVTDLTVTGTLDISGSTFTGVLPLANGGTGASTAAGARTNLGLGSLAVLNTINNSNWSGTDLSVANGGTGASTLTGLLRGNGTSAITGGSTINNDDWSGTDLAIVNGGTGSSTASGARSNLGLVIGSDVQAYDADTAKLDVTQTWTASQTFGGAVYTSWSGGDIATIVGGFTGSGALIQAPNSAHLVFALKENGSDDSFSFISGGGNYTSNSLYDTLVAKFEANGDISFPSGTTSINTLSLTTDLAVTHGGTGASNAASARSNLAAAYTATTMTAGNGLTGGGSLAADRTFTLGTPSTITVATTNGVTSSSHTHALSFSGARDSLIDEINQPGTGGSPSIEMSAIDGSGNKLWSGANTFEDIEITGGSGAFTDSNGLSITNSAPEVRIKDDNSTGSAQFGIVRYIDSSDATTAYLGFASTGNSTVYIRNYIGDLLFYASNTNVAEFSSSLIDFNVDVNIDGGNIDGTDIGVSNMGYGAFDQLYLTSTSPSFFLTDNSSTGNAQSGVINFRDGNGTTTGQIGYYTTSNSYLRIYNSLDDILFYASGTLSARVTSSGFQGDLSGTASLSNGFSNNAELGGTYGGGLSGTKRMTVNVTSSIEWCASYADSTESRTHIFFENPNGAVGSIHTSGSGTGFNTTSDENEKDFIEFYNPLDAMGIIRADPVWLFSWKKTQETSVGWGAQTSYKVHPDLAAPGGWFDVETGEETNEQNPNSKYRPWGIDQGKRTPYIWAVLPWMDDRIRQLEAEIVELRERLEPL